MDKNQLKKIAKIFSIHVKEIRQFYNIDSDNSIILSKISEKNWKKIPHGHVYDDLVALSNELVNAFKNWDKTNIRSISILLTQILNIYNNLFWQLMDICSYLKIVNSKGKNFFSIRDINTGIINSWGDKLSMLLKSKNTNCNMNLTFSFLDLRNIINHPDNVKLDSLYINNDIENNLTSFSNYASIYYGYNYINIRFNLLNDFDCKEQCGYSIKKNILTICEENLNKNISFFNKVLIENKKIFLTQNEKIKNFILYTKGKTDDIINLNNIEILENLEKIRKKYIILLKKKNYQTGHNWYIDEIILFTKNTKSNYKVKEFIKYFLIKEANALLDENENSYDKNLNLSNFIECDYCNHTNNINYTMRDYSYHSKKMLSYFVSDSWPDTHRCLVALWYYINKKNLKIEDILYDLFANKNIIIPGIKLNNKNIIEKNSGYLIFKYYYEWLTKEEIKDKNLNPQIFLIKKQSKEWKEIFVKILNWEKNNYNIYYNSKGYNEDGFNKEQAWEVLLKYFKIL